MGHPVYGRAPTGPRRMCSPACGGEGRARDRESGRYGAAVHLDIRAIADAIGYPAAGLGILIESAGIPFPGEAMLLAVTAYAALGHLDIRLVVAVAALGALTGANLGYSVGYFGGRPFVERMGRFLHTGPSHIARSELFFARYGGVTVLVARFVLGPRTWPSVMPGMSPLPL